MHLFQLFDNQLKLIFIEYLTFMIKLIIFIQDVFIIIAFLLILILAINYYFINEFFFLLISLQLLII